MTKYIEVLDKSERNGYAEINYVLRVDVPASISALSTKTVEERTGVLSLGAGMTVAQMKAELLSRWQSFKTEIESTAKWKYYGTYYDGTKWIDGGLT